jgi:hypothetical protein
MFKMILYGMATDGVPAEKTCILVNYIWSQLVLEAMHAGHCVPIDGAATAGSGLRTGGQPGAQ